MACVSDFYLFMQVRCIFNFVIVNLACKKFLEFLPRLASLTETN